jgi:hypothetical protein
MNQEIDPTTIIEATPVSMIKPSGSKKKKSKRSKRDSTPIAEEEIGTPSPSIEKSKKKKKSKKSKIGSSKKAHSMTSLYLDPFSSEAGDANTGASTVHDQQQPVTDKADSEIKRHPMTQQVIDSVLKAIQEPNVATDVATSLSQGEEETTVVANTPEKDLVVENQPTMDEEPKDDTQSDKGEKAKDSEEEEGSKASDRDVDGDTVVVEDYDSDLPLQKLAEASIARRTRSGKALVAASSKEDKTKGKSTVKPVRYGPRKGYSKAVVQPEKKKNLKRKEPPSSDSEYDREQDVPHISESEEEEEQDVELDVVHIETSVKKSYRKKKIP